MPSVGNLRNIEGRESGGGMQYFKTKYKPDSGSRKMKTGLFCYIWCSTFLYCWKVFVLSQALCDDFGSGWRMFLFKFCKLFLVEINLSVVM